MVREWTSQPKAKSPVSNYNDKQRVREQLPPVAVILAEAMAMQEAVKSR